MSTNRIQKTRRKKIVARKPGSARPARRTVIILECDPVTLAAQSFTTARDLDAAVRTLVPSARRCVIPATSQQTLQLELARCLQGCGRSAIVAVCGHSNQTGLRLAADLFVSWEAFARWIAPFKPKHLVLVACQGGRWLPSKALFEGIPTLQEVYGSPAAVTDQQAEIVKLLVPYVLANGRPPQHILQIAQVGNFLLTRGVIFRQTRKEFERTGVAEGLLWTMLEDFLIKGLAR